jgi:hypothetical protein
MIKAAMNRGDLRPTPPDSSHPAIRLLKRLGRDGVPVCMTTPPWSPVLRQEHLEQGSHKSCYDHFEFLREEMLDKASGP